MPINVDDAKKQITKKLYSIPIIHKAIRNPIFTSLAVVIVFIIILLFVFRNVEIYTDDEESFCRLILRVGIYSFIVITGLIFLNNYYLKDEFKSQQVSGAMEEIFDGVDVVSKNSSYIPVSVTLPKYGL